MNEWMLFNWRYSKQASMRNTAYVIALLVKDSQVLKHLPERHGATAAVLHWEKTLKNCEQILLGIEGMYRVIQRSRTLTGILSAVVGILEGGQTNQINMKRSVRIRRHDVSSFDVKWWYRRQIVIDVSRVHNFRGKRERTKKWRFTERASLVRVDLMHWLLDEDVASRYGSYRLRRAAHWCAREQVCAAAYPEYMSIGFHHIHP